MRKTLPLLLILLPLSCPAYDKGTELAGWRTATQLLDSYPVRKHSRPIANFEAKLEEINREINAVPYTDDAEVYREQNVWQTPVQFYQTGGQCRDYAIAKYHALYALGVADADMLFAAVTIRSGKHKGEFHAVLLVKHAGRTYILDSLDQNVRPATAMADYQPVYFVNRLGWRAAQ